LLAVFATLAGCPGPGWLAQGFKKKTDAVYKIKNLPTVVLVDAPEGEFVDPAIKGVIAAKAGHLLKQDNVIDKVIGQDEVNRLAAREGAKFAKMPLDQIGRELGAAQVIHVSIDEVDAGNAEVASQPRLKMRVKLLDVENRKRLFPAPSPEGAGEGTTGLGYPLNVEFRYRMSGNATAGEASVMLNKLADRAGRDLAWLFYRHTARQPGEAYED